MPAQTEHHVGGTKHFECRVGGYPRPQIRWYKDGKEITNCTRYQFDHSNDGVITMVIQNITHEDEGHYRCRAENSEGLASTSAYLLVRAHKEIPDEPISSVHSMQFEEAIVYSEKYKRAREIRKKIEALDNENSYEDMNKYQSNRHRQDEEEEEELTWKSIETVISTQLSSSKLVTTTSLTSTQKDEVEEESSKISKDMLEKTYHSSDDDGDSVRLKTISERSEPLSLQESLKDFDEDEEKSLLMRQTARLFSHELDEDEDFFKLDSQFQAVVSGIVGEQHAVEDETTSKLEVRQVKSETETLQMVKSTANSKTSEGDRKVADDKESKSEVMTEVKVEQKVSEVKAVDDSSDETKQIIITKKVESSSYAKVETQGTLTESVVNKSSEASTELEDTIEAKKLTQATTESLTSSTKEKVESTSVKILKETDIKLQEDETDSKRVESVSSSKDEQQQQAVVTKTDIRSEEEEEESVSDSETEGSVGSVVGVDFSTSSALKRNQESSVDIDSTASNQNANKGVIEVNRQQDEVKEDLPVIQPVEDEADGRTEEIVEQRTSWVKKVAEDKLQPDAADEATAIGGDKEEVKTKPKIKQNMEDIKIEAGKTLRLRTQIEASPRAEVTWSKEGEVIIAGERITIVTEEDVYTLVIENVGEADTGRYRMTAINSAGSVYSEVLVNIVGLPQQPTELRPSLPVGHPQFVMSPQNVTVAEFESIKLSCSVKGDPIPKVTWAKDGHMLRTSKHIRLYESRGVYFLEIPEAEAEDAGEYVCTAVNSQGTVTATVTVSMQGFENIVQVSGEPESTGEQLEGAVGGAVESSSDVCRSDSRSVRYLKLFGMAAAFSLAAIGVKKLMENLPK